MKQHKVDLSSFTDTALVQCLIGYNSPFEEKHKIPHTPVIFFHPALVFVLFPIRLDTYPYSPDTSIRIE